MNESWTDHITAIRFSGLPLARCVEISRKSLGFYIIKPINKPLMLFFAVVRRCFRFDSGQQYLLLLQIHHLKCLFEALTYVQKLFTFKCCFVIMPFNEYSPPHNSSTLSKQGRGRREWGDIIMCNRSGCLLLSGRIFCSALCPDDRECFEGCRGKWFLYSNWNSWSWSETTFCIVRSSSASEWRVSRKIVHRQFVIALTLISGFYLCPAVGLH